MITSYVALDLETSGLNPVEDNILEVGAVKVEDNKVIDTYQTFVKFDGKINARIHELTGITDAMVSQGKSIEAALEDVFGFCKDYILLGHNIKFDFSFLNTYWLGYG